MILTLEAELGSMEKRESGTGTVGSAMLTGVAMGVFRDLEEAASKMIEKTMTYEPRPRYHEKYLEVYGRYEKVYDAVRGLV